MYKRILVPIDGSETSKRAMLEAIRLTSGETQLRLVYVIEDNYLPEAEGYTFIDHAALMETVRQSGERTLAQAEAKIQQSGMSAETALINADGERVATVIESEARDWHADLIVIGTHGRTGISRLLMGSVAEGVVRMSSVPVLLVREGRD